MIVYQTCAKASKKRIKVTRILVSLWKIKGNRAIITLKEHEGMIVSHYKALQLLLAIKVDT